MSKFLPLFVLGMTALDGFAQDNSTSETLIRTSKPLPGGAAVALRRDDSVADKELYAAQLAALVSLASLDQIPADDGIIGDVIGFLAYPINPTAALIALDHDVDRREIVKQWPAFAILLKINKADKVAEYALDKENPTRLRLASWQVIRYLDEKEFARVGAMLASEFSENKTFAPYIRIVQKARMPFWGVPDLKEE